MLKRVTLFILTNLVIVATIGVLLRLLGVDRMALGDQTLDLRTLLVYSAVVGFTGSFISLAMSKSIAKWSTGARVIREPRTETEAWLVRTVEKLARQAGIGMPEVAIFDASEMNAFATGMRRNAALVAVSAGLLEGMRRDEVEAVLGHEVAHVANGDMVTLTLLQGVMNTFVFFLSRVVGHVVDRLIFRTERGRGAGYYITVMVTQMGLALVAAMIVMAYSRRREFRADAGSAGLVGRGAMIGALERLQRDRQPAQLPASMAAFGIRGSAGGLRRLLASHPPLEERIAALRAGV